jgi:CRISPR-associated endonuclease Csn1
MKTGMRYRLALDLGSTSLGWAMIRLNAENNPCAVIKAGVRIYSSGRDSAPQGQQGESLAKVRREKRQARRRRDRMIRRKVNVKALLVKHGLFPTTVMEQKELEVLDPYQLRAEGLTQKMPLFHLGRALFHLNVRRGFKSNRKTDTDDTDQSLIKAAMNRLDEHISTHKTLGSYLHSRRESIRVPAPGQAVVRAKSHVVFAPNKRNPEKTTEKNDWEFFIRRSMVEAEFDELWNAQKVFHKESLSEEAKTEIRREIFFQRKLRPVDPGRCTLLPNMRRAYRAYPVVQALIVIQTVNNLKILDQNLQGTPLAAYQRNALIEVLLQGQSLTWVGIKRTLKLPGVTLFNLENGGDMREGIDGDQTAKMLSQKKYFGSSWNTQFSDQLKHQIVWRILNTQDEVALTRWLAKVSRITHEKAQVISKVSLPSGVQQFSRRVVSAVVQQLRSHISDEPLILNEAIAKAGFGSHSALAHGEQGGSLLDQLPSDYGAYMARHVGLNGRIANPTVHIGLNQLRVVVNALITTYGKPEEIHIELARDLKLNAKQREKANIQNKRNRDARTARRNKFIEAFQYSPTDADLEKMALWEELNLNDCAARQCPYSGKSIGTLKALFSPEVQVEHILPRSLVLDDSMNNKTLAFVFANNAKGDKSPFDAFGGNPTIAGFQYSYESILSRAKMMSREKYMRFAPNAIEWWLGRSNSMPDRYLNETRHLSVVAREYLSLVCKQEKIVCTNGQLTAMVRDALHLNLILSADNRKNRNDHRHHAVDACVIGAIDRRFIQLVQAAARATTRYRTGKFVESMPDPWQGFFMSVERAVKAIKVSHRPDHSFEGELFSEIHAYALDLNGNPIQKKKVRGDERGYERASTVPIFHRSAVMEERAPYGDETRPYKSYPSKGNFCLEILVDEQGRWDFEAIPRYVAYRHAVQLGGKPHEISKMARKVYDSKLSSKPGRVLMKLVKNDCIAYQVDEKGKPKILKLMQINQKGGGTFCEIHESNESERARKRGEVKKKLAREERITLKEEHAAKDQIYVGQLGIKALLEGKARRVTISPIGELRDPGFKE